MTLPVVKFEDYRGRVRPHFNLNARLLTWGANFIFSKRLKADKAADLLQSTVTGLGQIKFSKGSESAIETAFMLYNGAASTPTKKQFQSDQVQKYRDLMAYYILTNMPDVLSQQRYQLSQKSIDDYEDLLKQILSDYARGSHYDEELRGEIFSHTYHTLRFMNTKFGITLGQSQATQQPSAVLA